MNNSSLQEKPRLKEIIPPPIIFKSRGPQHRTAKSSEIKKAITQKHECPQCGFELKTA